MGNKSSQQNPPTATPPRTSARTNFSNLEGEPPAVSRFVRQNIETASGRGSRNSLQTSVGPSVNNNIITFQPVRPPRSNSVKPLNDKLVSNPSQNSNQTTLKYSHIKNTSTHPLSENTSTPPLPRNTSTQPLPKKTSTRPLPKNTTTRPLPRNTSTNPLSENISTHPLPKETSTPQFLQNTSTEPFPKNTSTNPFLQNTSTPSFLENTSTPQFLQNTSTYTLPRNTSTQPTITSPPFQTAISPDKHCTNSTYTSYDDIVHSLTIINNSFNKLYPARRLKSPTPPKRDFVKPQKQFKTSTGQTPLRTTKHNKTKNYNRRKPRKLNTRIFEKSETVEKTEEVVYTYKKEPYDYFVRRIIKIVDIVKSLPKSKLERSTMLGLAYNSQDARLLENCIESSVIVSDIRLFKKKLVIDVHLPQYLQTSVLKDDNVDYVVYSYSGEYALANNTDPEESKTFEFEVRFVNINNDNNTITIEHETDKKLKLNLKLVKKEKLINLIENKNNTHEEYKVEQNSFLQSLEKAAKDANNLKEKLNKVEFIYTDEDKNKLSTIYYKVYDLYEFYKESFTSLAQLVRCHGDISMRIEHILPHVEEVVQIVNESRNYFKGMTDKYIAKAKLISFLLKLNIIYLPEDVQLQQFIEGCGMDEVFALCLNDEMGNQFLFSSLEKFLQLVSEKRQSSDTKNTTFVVREFQNNSNSASGSSILHLPGKVQHYQLKNLVSVDYFKDLDRIAHKVQGKPDRRLAKLGSQTCVLKILCPGVYLGLCPTEPRVWGCARCQTKLQYGFNDVCYCECGAHSVENLKFKCDHYSHQDYYEYEKDKLTDALNNLKPIRSINLLILGQSGVGKSTWINGILNYLSYSSLSEAEQNELYAAIPAQFHHNDKDNDNQDIHITIGVDRNENQETGQSATQKCKTYTVFGEDCVVRFIDTPGLCDSRGYNQDVKNIQFILEHLRQFDTLDGICILLKPNTSRMEASFTFCVKEILCQLHRKMLSNISFCFTNSRHTFYKPGDVLPLLHRIFEEANARISLGAYNMYCLDNEAFRFLCTLKYNIKWSKKEFNEFNNSWERSVEETKRMFQHYKDKEPKEVEDLLFVARLKNKVLILSKVLTHIDKEREDAIASKNKANSDIDNTRKEITELRNMLLTNKLTVTSLVKQTTGNRRIVCTDPKCCTVYSGDTEYKVCCDNCQEVTDGLNSINNASLRYCTTRFGSTVVNCTGCGCRYESHMLIDYIQTKQQVTKVNEDVEKEIRNKEQKIINLERKILEKDEKVEDLVQERIDVNDLSVRFGGWLKRKTIIPYNDSLKDYIDYVISDITSKPDKTDADRALIKEMEDVKLRSQEEVKILDQVMNFSFRADDEIGLKDLNKKYFTIIDKYGMKDDTEWRNNRNDHRNRARPNYTRHKVNAFMNQLFD